MVEFETIVGNGGGYNEVQLHPSNRFIRKFGILNLNTNGTFRLDTQDNEYALLILEGICAIEVDGKDYGEIKSRVRVFDGLPSAVYVPADSQFSIVGRKAKIAICGGKCDKKTEPVLITPDQIKVIDVGKGNWSREVRLIIAPDGPSANIVLGETMNPPGNWSGTPPHRHENDNLPIESLHEELYYFKTDKPQGWGIERLYSPEQNMNELVYIQDDTVTFMPNGYHQIVAGPGYTLYYLFFLAGKGSQLKGFEDPDHNWIKDA